MLGDVEIEKLEHCYWECKMVNGAATVEKQFFGFSMVYT